MFKYVQVCSENVQSMTSGTPWLGRTCRTCGSSVAGVLSSIYLCMVGRLEERILGVVAHVSLLTLPVETWENKKVCSGQLNANFVLTHLTLLYLHLSLILMANTSRHSLQT